MQEKDWHSKCFYRVSIKALILNENSEILVVNEKNNPKWNLPGGGMDYGENEYDALKRELYEEVGYDGNFDFTPLGIRPMYLEGKSAWQLWVVYHVAPKHYNFKVGEDSNGLAFMAAEELISEKPYVGEFFNRALDLKAS